MKYFFTLIQAASMFLGFLIAGTCAADGLDASSIGQTPSAVNGAKPTSEPEPNKAPKKWVCEADGLANFRYSGGDWAYIHLSSYSYGHEYRVKKNEVGDIARGVTQDTTPFVCTNK